MKKINYILQMNGFLKKMRSDKLPASAVMLYLVLFEEFNNKRWLAEWIRLTARELMYKMSINSMNLVYRSCAILEQMGYIERREGGTGSRRYTEYKLLLLYGAGEEKDARAVGTPLGTRVGTPFGTEMAHEGASLVDLQAAQNRKEKNINKSTTVVTARSEYTRIKENKEKRDEIDGRAENNFAAPVIVQDASVEQEKTGEVKITEEALDSYCMAFEDSLERPLTPEEETKVLDLLLEYGIDSVLDALVAVREEPIKSMEFCENFLRQSKWLVGGRRSNPIPQEASAWRGWRRA